MDRETCALQHYRLTVRRIRSLRKIGRFTGKKNINTIIERCRAEAGRSSPSPPGPVIAGNVSARTVPDATDGPPESKTGRSFRRRASPGVWGSCVPLPFGRGAELVVVLGTSHGGL